MANAHAKHLNVFRVLRKKKLSACLKRVFAIVIKRSQLALFCTVWENKDFLSQNTAAETSNQHLHR